MLLRTSRIWNGCRIASREVSSALDRSPCSLDNGGKRRNKLAQPGQAKMGKRLSVAVQGFHPSSFLSEETARLRELVQDKKVISAVSGGVDSTVATLVAREALGDRLLPIMIDTGFLRAGEPERVKERLAISPTLLKVRLVHASGLFLAFYKYYNIAEEKQMKLREIYN